MKVVSSFSPDGYELYGRRFLESYVKHCDVPLIVYYEAKIPDFSHPLIHFKDLYSIPTCREFLEIMAKLPVFSGIINNQRDFRYDVARFSRKVFAQWDAAQGDNGKLFWIDADVEFESRLPRVLLEKTLDGVFMAYLGRSLLYPCSSFVGWDNSHPDADGFWHAYYTTLVSGQILVQPEWHDAFYINAVRTALGVSSRDLTAHLKFGGRPGNVFSEFFRGIAAHKKGLLKNTNGPQRYEWLLELVRRKQPKHILEVGTWNGVRALEMIRASPGARYYGFDLFEEGTPELDSVEKNVKPHHSVQNVSAMLTAQGVPHELHKGNSRETLQAFGNGKTPFIDFAFIDGGHSVDTIRSDWECVRAVMAPGGLVVFDDYYEGLSPGDLDLYGANKVLEGLDYELLPPADPIVGGGTTRLAVVRIPH